MKKECVNCPHLKVVNQECQPLKVCTHSNFETQKRVPGWLAPFCFGYLILLGTVLGFFGEFLNKHLFVYLDTFVDFLEQLLF